VPGIRLINWDTRNVDLDEKITSWNNRVKHNQNFWHYGSEMADVKQIKTFFNIFQSKSSDIKFRIEGCTFNMYSNSEQLLYQLASVELEPWKKSLVSISLVESDSARELLEKGMTIVKTKPEYIYRVKLKEGFQKTSERTGLAVYLHNLGKDIRLSELMFDRLKADTKYFSGGYVYLNDPRLIDMLKLVAPNLIGPVDQMVNQ
jgi:hypothetical protein